MDMAGTSVKKLKYKIVLVYATMAYAGIEV
jgi:hypothetical protein